MIDHVGCDVSDYARSRAFYSQVLAPLGHGVVMAVSYTHLTLPTICSV